jgi:hypothetical protein
MAKATTVIYLKPGTVLTDEQREELLAKALQTHYYDQFSKMPPAEREKVARELAHQLIAISNQCGKQHELSDLSNRLELIKPNQALCESFEELSKEIIEFRYTDKRETRSKFSRKFRLGVGLMWKGLREALGLPAVEPDKNTGSWAGPRG